MKLLESKEGWKYGCAGKCKAIGFHQMVSEAFSGIVLDIVGISGEEEDLQNLIFQEYLAF